MIFKTKYNFYFCLILLLAFLLRFPGLFWGQLGSENYDILEPDEHVHMAIAIELMQKWDASIFEEYHPKRLNVPGFGVQLAVLAYPIMKITDSNYKYLAVCARLLSLFYSLLLIWLIYKIGWWLFQNKNTGLWAAFFLSLFDLNITYSHYGVPDISYVFWAYLSIFFTMKFWEIYDVGKDDFAFPTENHKIRSLLILSLGLGITMAVRLDFVPILVFVISIFYFLKFSTKAIFLSWKYLFITMLFALFFFEAGIGFQHEKLVESVFWLSDENQNLIAGNRHLFMNPILYLIGIIAGLGFIALPFIISGIRNIREQFNRNTTFWHFFLILLGFVILEFMIRWKMNATFVRRCNIFLPFLAILLALGFQTLILQNQNLNSRFKRILSGFTILYFLSFAIISQSNFIFDNRYEAREFLKKELTDNSDVYYCPYSKIKNLPGRQVPLKEAEYLVLHESYYSRYWKCFTTPFHVPKCCEGVYHCHSEDECKFFQNLFQNGKEYEMIFENHPFDIFPERLLFKKWLGNYETFLGDVKIYRRKI